MEHWEAATSPLPAMQFGWIGQSASIAEGRGVKVQRLLLESGVAPNQERIAPNTWLDPAEYNLMCVLLINAVDDEMHGATRSRMKRGTASMSVKLIGTAKTLEAAICTLSRFYKMAGAFCDATLVREVGTATIEIRADGGESFLTPVVEELMATHLHMLFSYYLGFVLPLDKFVTPAIAHPHVGSVHPYLKCRVHTGATTKLIFSSKYLNLTSKNQISDKLPVDTVLFWLSRFANAGDDAPWLDGTSPTSAQVYNALLEDDLRFAECCSLLARSQREIMHELIREGTSYRELRRAALIERVRPHLIANASADDLAFALGYSDGRSLRRAIKLAGGFSLSDLRHDGPQRSGSWNGVVVTRLREELARMG